MPPNEPDTPAPPASPPAEHETTAPLGIPESWPDAELLCVKCGYDLRLLKTSGKCPECGTSILRSIPFRPALTRADWDKIRRALRRIIIANCVGAVCFFIAWAIVDSSPSSASLTAAFTVLGAIFAAATIWRARGYTLLVWIVKPDRALEQHWQPGASVSFSSVFRAVLACLAVLCLVLADLPYAPTPLLHMLAGSAAIAYVCIGCIQFFAVLTILEMIGLRANARHLVRLAKILAVLCAFALIPGACLYGAGIPISWLIYHALLLRFALFASTRLRAAG